ncbi:MAG: hypothetical protein WAN36_12330 [Calditrichia bacterium]
MSKNKKKLHQISRRLPTHQLRRLREEQVKLDYQEIVQSLGESGGSPYFLGYYSPTGIEFALERYGFLDRLRRQGFEELKVVVNTHDPYKQRIALYFKKKLPSHLLGELVVKRNHIMLYPPFQSKLNGRSFEVVVVEWLCMQNPQGRFSAKKPRLPGQKYPGLGMGSLMMELLVIMCRRLRVAGLLNMPEHFHNAQMYSSQFFYLDPIFEARRFAIARDLLKQYNLAEISWAIDLELVKENDQPFKWFTAEQIIPLNPDLKEYLKSREYRRRVKTEAGLLHYSLDESEWQKKQQDIEGYVTC